ncbi:hypothetical protein ABPG77_007549 [Micractinium sp. CCAP 211/92]
MNAVAAVGALSSAPALQGSRSSPVQRRHAARQPAPARRRAVCRPQALGQDPAVAGTGLSPELRSAIEQFITENKVVAFIKGTKQFPQCGFSNTVVQILNSTSVPYVTVNVLEDELLRSGMKEYSQWPTFPQVYINGEFIGGADIMIAAYTSGELAETLEAAMNS